MLSNDQVEYLSSILPFWNKLNDDQKELIINNSSLVNYKKEAHIHNGSSECVGIIIVKSGTLRTYMMSDEGKEVTLYRLFDGDLCTLSASCLLDNITFDVYIDAEVDSQVFLINSNILSTLIKDNIYVENFSYKATIDRFSDVMWTMEQILFMKFDQRLALFLIEESSKNKSNILYLTHTQIAKYIGSAREVVSRMLKYFADDGLISLSRGSLTIIDKDRLLKLYLYTNSK